MILLLSILLLLVYTARAADGLSTSAPLIAGAVDLSFDFAEGVEGFYASPLVELHHWPDDETLRIMISGSGGGGGTLVNSPPVSLPLSGTSTLIMRCRSSSGSQDGTYRLQVVTADDDNDEISVPFSIIGDGRLRTLYSPVPIDGVDHKTLTKIEIALESAHGAFHIDFLRLARRPLIQRVTGCSGEVHSSTSSFAQREYSIATDAIDVNVALSAERTVWFHRNSSLPYGQAFNCRRNGGETITIEGENFGQGGLQGVGVPAHVLIAGEPCVNVTHDKHRPQQILTCVAPPMDADLQESMGPLISQSSIVQVKNGALPGLADGKRYFIYAKAPPPPIHVASSNAASHAIDIAWTPGGSEWSQNMIITGYVLRWRTDKSSSSDWSEMVVGNVTKTTIRGLQANSRYYIVIAGLAGDQEKTGWWKDLDLYGRVQDTTILSEMGRALEGLNNTISVHTLADDISFDSFDANKTQNHGAIDPGRSIDPRGIEGGEGHHGLALIGDAAILNCNSSSFCCDGYDPLLGGCRSEALTCRSSPYRESDDSRFIFDHFNETSGLADITAACGPALRLTGASDRLRGAVWYRRPQEVAEGFTTAFRYRITEPSTRCNVLNDVHEHCVSRGADGLAFAIQGQGIDALGDGGQGLGYAGIANSLAIEIDTFFNDEVLDPYHNHISIHTRGWKAPNESNHSYSLGHTTAVPDLTSGEIDIKIEYIPRFDAVALSKPSFVASPHLATFVQHFPEGGLGDWGGDGLGMLRVYCNDLREPVLIVPLNLAATLNLDGGRAFVGFTAATGEDTWQAHDVVEWKFSSYRMDSEYYEPVVTNGIGAHS